MTEWNQLYGCYTKQIATINMCGGCAEWWNYVYHFNPAGEIKLFREDNSGLHLLDNDIVLIYHIDEEEIREEDSSTNLELKDDELLIDYDFFCWD